jgi:hypothetical protein
MPQSTQKRLFGAAYCATPEQRLRTTCLGLAWLRVRPWLYVSEQKNLLYFCLVLYYNMLK